jgi:hypothetical protein
MLSGKNNVFDVAGGFVTWSSKKQPSVVLLHGRLKETIWLCILLKDLGFAYISTSYYNLWR